MKFETLAVHAGFAPDPTTRAVAVPIYQTTSYAFDDTQHGADLFDLKVPGNIYTRIMNPTTDVLEKRLAALEGGVGALALASGQAAVTYAIQTITEAGQNLISSSALYGGTYNLFAHTLPQYGITVKFADHRDPASFEGLIDARTRAIFCESVGNPAGNVTDFAALAEVAHRHGLPLIVDNTVPSPYLCRPFEHGADVVVHSLTKYLGGHGTSIGGALIDDRTKAVFCESIGKPLGNVSDIAALAKVAHDHGVPLIVDNTVPTPYLLRPFEHGADIVVHALTKYLNGHGNSIGGIIVDSGTFPWATHASRFRRLNEPDVSYHGVVYTQALGPAAYIGRARVVPLRNMGGAISPFNAWLALHGIETLALRMDRICDNTLAIARFLSDHPGVTQVDYAGLPQHPRHALAKKYMGGRASGILTFGVQGGREAGARFLDALKLFTRLVNIGDVRSLATHPASTTHRQLSPGELKAAGVTEETVRLSIGIEHVEDLKADLAQALAAAVR